MCMLTCLGVTGSDDSMQKTIWIEGETEGGREKGKNQRIKGDMTQRMKG